MTEETKKEVWYRYDYTAPYPGVEIHLQEYPVLKKTPKGVRLDIWFGYKPEKEKGKFVLFDSTKRYACPTIEEAKASFIARKEKQLKILKNQIRDIECALKLISEGKTRGISDVEFITSIGE